MNLRLVIHRRSTAHGTLPHLSIPHNPRSVRIEPGAARCLFGVPVRVDEVVLQADAAGRETLSATITVQASADTLDKLGRYCPVPIFVPSLEGYGALALVGVTFHEQPAEIGVLCVRDQVDAQCSDQTIAELFRGTSPFGTDRPTGAPFDDPVSPAKATDVRIGDVRSVPPRGDDGYTFGTPGWFDDVFTYHPPTPKGPRAFAETIIAVTPACSDQRAAIRKVREAVMTANAAIALKGRA